MDISFLQAAARDHTPTEFAEKLKTALENLSQDVDVRADFTRAAMDFGKDLFKEARKELDVLTSDEHSIGSKLQPRVTTAKLYNACQIFQAVHALSDKDDDMRNAAEEGAFEVHRELALLADTHSRWMHAFKLNNAMARNHPEIIL